MRQFKKVKETLRMSEAIAKQIENQIFQGQLDAGELLPSETALMKDFGVGRYTVREAFRMLETSGFIKIKQGAQGGAVITKLTNEFVSDFLIKAIRFGEVTPSALSQFRLALEPSIAAIAAEKQNIKQEFIVEMENNISHVRALFKKKKVTAYGNMDFHVLLAEATENPMFIIFLKTLRAGFNLILPLNNQTILDTLIYHERILEAVKNHSPEVARKQMTIHLVQMSDLFATHQISSVKPASKDLKVYHAGLDPASSLLNGFRLSPE
jgi:GntR family transcriptional regulator, transcriptional repressor for pyruvate dehydrogenase complex